MKNSKIRLSHHRRSHFSILPFSTIIAVIFGYFLTISTIVLNRTYQRGSFFYFGPTQSIGTAIKTMNKKNFFPVLILYSLLINLMIQFKLNLWEEDFFFRLASVLMNKEWYFVTKIVLTYCEKKLFSWSRKTFEIRGWWPRICKKFEITRTIYSNSERSEQFLVTECFFNLFLEVSHIQKIRKIRIHFGKNYWDLETCRKS